MSDATFRIDDWGASWVPMASPRPLHIRQAMESIDFGRGPVNPIAPEVEPIDGGGTRERLSRSSYFALERLRTQAGVHDRGTRRSVHDSDGSGGLL